MGKGGVGEVRVRRDPERERRSRRFQSPLKSSHTIYLIAVLSSHTLILVCINCCAFEDTWL